MKLTISKTSQFTIIAGPCAIESEEICRQVAEELLRICKKFEFQYVFKSSYKKANRTSGESFRGVGIKKGLQILKKVKEELGIPILTDVHETKEIMPVNEVADIIQIPAFLSRQTELIEESAKTGKLINIKKGQFMSPQEAILAANKAYAVGNKDVLITERGTFFGYHNLVVDFRTFHILDEAGIPVIYDVTHSLQLPGANKISAGTPEFANCMSRAAAATGHLSGLFLEAHPQPEEAKSDALSMLPLSKIEPLLESIYKILPTL
jgi:2-dehydro-3-deoxyphosphooctonate aldolase (KDO 8-P synthase)